MNSALADVELYALPENVLRATLTELKRLSGGQREAFVVWGGRVDEHDPTRLQITSALVPAQTATSTRDGLLVVVEGDALFAVNRRLYERSELLVGQVHTHPGHAYHSETDDDFPLVTLTGGVSLVVHDFARHGMRQRDQWAWYRLRDLGQWERLDPDLSVAVV